ncbi:MAG TPA: LacI family DNA-binding transcriptional regulator [Trebonia sp.]|nr:LacI family DNA-binding transcriptional regulator [Trebonia sp.]
MRDVAAAAGVSPMTVSRVVNGEPSVQPETAARVERAIRELGYQRNDTARQLRRKGQATQTLGLVVDDLANPFFAGLASAVEDVARQRQYIVLIGSSNSDLRRERELIVAFSARRVDGMIIVPAAGSHRFLREHIATGTKVVCVDRRADGLDLDRVVVDNRRGALTAIGRLIDQGHRRIGYLGDHQGIWTVQERYAGYAQALAARGIAPDPSLIRHGLRTRPEAAAAAAALLRHPAPPTAVFASNDVMTMGAVDGLYGRGKPVTLVGFDDFALADKLTPPVSVVVQDPAAIGATAAQLLFSRIGGDASPAREVVLATRLLMRP